MAKAAPRREHGRSIASQDRAVVNAAMPPIEPPATVRLRDSDRSMWVAIVGARSRDEWSDIDLQHAANLARCFSDIERIGCEIAEEGDVCTNDRGTRHANPKHALLETLTRRAVALTRLLHLHASALVGQPRDVANAREAEGTAREAMAHLDADDDLLARPGARLN